MMATSGNRFHCDPIANSPITAAGPNVIAPVAKAAPTTLACSDDVTVANATVPRAGHANEKSLCC